MSGEIEDDRGCARPVPAATTDNGTAIAATRMSAPATAPVNPPGIGITYPADTLQPSEKSDSPAIGSLAGAGDREASGCEATPKRNRSTTASAAAGDDVRIATWNVNSLKARLDKVLWWLDRARPDVLLMQETKLADADAPRGAFRAAGYELAHHGEGRWNGVAIAKIGRAHV